jgi:hypothetical protein
MMRTIILTLLFLFGVSWAETPVELTETQTFSIEGQASLAPDMYIPQNWQANSRVLLDYGKYVGFLR